MEPNDLTINITLRQAQALHKTIGIAIDNIQTKISRTANPTVVAQSNDELNSLIGVQQQVLSILMEVGA